LYHFLYNSFEEHPGGRDYIGAHSTEDLYDGYLGSFSDKSFKPTSRIIISFYPCRKSLIKAEISIQKMLNVVEDPQYANRAYQTSTGFCCLGAKFPGKNTGIKWSEEAKENRRGEGNPNYGKIANLKTRNQMMLKKLGANNPMYGRSDVLGNLITVVDTEGVSHSFPSIRQASTNLGINRKTLAKVALNSGVIQAGPFKGWGVSYGT